MTSADELKRRSVELRRRVRWPRPANPLEDPIWAALARRDWAFLIGMPLEQRYGAADALISLLDHPDDDLRTHATAYLLTWGPAAADTLAYDPVCRGTPRARELRAQLDAHRIEESLWNAAVDIATLGLQSPDPHYRNEALVLLSMTGGDRALGMLVAALRRLVIPGSPRPGQVHILGIRAPERIMDCLVAALQHEDENIRGIAREVDEHIVEQLPETNRAVYLLKRRDWPRLLAMFGGTQQPYFFPLFKDKEERLYARAFSDYWVIAKGEVPWKPSAECVEQLVAIARSLLSAPDAAQRDAAARVLAACNRLQS